MGYDRFTCHLPWKCQQFPVLHGEIPLLPSGDLTPVVRDRSGQDEAHVGHGGHGGQQEVENQVAPLLEPPVIPHRMQHPLEHRVTIAHFMLIANFAK